MSLFDQDIYGTSQLKMHIYSNHRRIYLISNYVFIVKFCTIFDKRTKINKKRPGLAYIKNRENSFGKGMNHCMDDSFQANG